MKVFVIADHPDEGDMLKLVLRHAGLEVDLGLDLDRVLKQWSRRWANLMLLASDTPTSVVEAVKTARQTTRVPLLIISDPLIESQLCATLEAGADLVLERPVAPRVLALYTQVLLRRTESIPTFVLPSLEWNDIKLDPATRTVTVARQEPRRLTQLEFNLLYVLMTNPEQVIPTEIIVERVWGYNDRGDRELVRGLISRLRHKLRTPNKKIRFIQTIPGVGYAFSLDES
jgi:DNA-binding response OmpR family regulator